MTPFSILESLLNENNGFLKASDVVAAGVSRTLLSAFVKEKGLVRAAKGLYISSSAWDDSLFVLQNRYPKVIFSHETSLHLLNMANREPAQINFTLPTGTSSWRLNNDEFKVYKVREDLFHIGTISTSTFSGNTVRAYNPERTIVDLFRSRKNIEIQVLHDAIRTYLSAEVKDIPLLLRYAKLFSVERIVKKYLEILL